MAGTRPLTPEEIALARSRLTGRDRLLYDTMLRTGLRASEALAIRRDWIRGGVLTVPADAMKRGERARAIPLPPKLLADLSAVAADMPHDDRLFQISRSTLHRLLKHAFEGFEGPVSAHSLRKTFAVRIWRLAGRDVGVVQAALDHSRMSSTFHYVPTRQEIARELIVSDED